MGHAVYGYKIALIDPTETQGLLSISEKQNLPAVAPAPAPAPAVPDVDAPAVEELGLTLGKDNNVSCPSKPMVEGCD